MLDRKEQFILNPAKWIDSRTLGSVFLIASCCLGAGMLALPMTTGIAGFFPSLLVFLLIWFYMLTTAKLLLEANSWFPGETINLITLAGRILGPSGKIIIWITFLFLFYCLLTAFLVKGGELIHAVLAYCRPGTSPHVSLILFTLLGFFLVIKGISQIDRINGFFLFAFFLSYFAIISLSTEYAHVNYLSHQSWSKSFFLLPFLVTSFGFHNIIPSIKQYLNNERKLRIAVNVGGTIPIFVYILWIAIMLSVIPLQGESGILTGFANNRLATETLSAIIGSPSFDAFVWLFAITTIITSIFGVSLSMVDFFIDGLQIKGKKNRLYGALLTFIPPLLFSQYNPRLFFTALELAGGFAVVILYGLMPALIVWRGRYFFNYKSTSSCMKTKGRLLIIMMVAIFIFILELLKTTGLIQLTALN